MWKKTRIDFRILAMLVLGDIPLDLQQFPPPPGSSCEIGGETIVGPVPKMLLSC